MTPSAPPPMLRLIHGAREDPSAWTWFCSQCAAAPSEDVSALARVCASCGMGLMLETQANAAPAPDDAFLVVDARLTVQSLSFAAEMLLGVIEDDAINQPVAHLLGAPEAEANGPDDLMTLIGAATTGSDQVHSISVRPLSAFGVRVVARVSQCGPPRAALVVLAPRAARRDLHLV
jgi:hypothetical protein